MSLVNYEDTYCDKCQNLLSDCVCGYDNDVDTVFEYTDIEIESGDVLDNDWLDDDSDDDDSDGGFMGGEDSEEDILDSMFPNGVDDGYDPIVEMGY